MHRVMTGVARAMWWWQSRLAATADERRACDMRGRSAEVEVRQADRTEASQKSNRNRARKEPTSDVYGARAAVRATVVGPELYVTRA